MSLATLRSSTVQTINDNILLATLRPEFFGPAIYTHGQTVALPVSGVDGYQYTRAECQYLSWWADTGPASQIRMPLFAYRIDPATGEVSINIWRLKPGGPANHTNEGSVNVVTVGMRIFEAPSLDPTGGTHNPPADVNDLVFDNTYDVWWSLPGKPPADTTYLIGTFPHPVRFSGDFLLAQGTSLIAATDPQSFPLYKNGLQVGAVTFGAGVTFGSPSSGFVDFDTGDALTISTPAVQDATLSDVAFTLVGKG